VGRHGKCQAQVHPAGKAFDGGINKLAHLGKFNDFVKFAVNFLPAHAKDRTVQINILAAGKFGMKTGPNLQQGAHPSVDLAISRVGSVTRDRIFSKVLLPAPFLPTIPSTWPRSTSKVISLSAQIYAKDPQMLPHPVLKNRPTR
jgi:hypothetical protein